MPRPTGCAPTLTPIAVTTPGWRTPEESAALGAHCPDPLEGDGPRIPVAVGRTSRTATPAQRRAGALQHEGGLAELGQALGPQRADQILESTTRGTGRAIG